MRILMINRILELTGGDEGYWRWYLTPMTNARLLQEFEDAVREQALA